MGHERCLRPSFETPRKSAAPQDEGGAVHRRTISVAPSGIASNTADASTAWICSVTVPEFLKPWLRPAGTISDWPAETIVRASSIHISASPSSTVSTSSTGWLWVGAPLPGAIHCSKMQSCVAPLAAATGRVTP